MANRFWVGGTGTWDASDTTHWASSTGAAGGQSVPGSSDAVVFDGSSGGGTVTVNTNASLLSLTSGAFTGTIDWSVNNNNFTIGANGMVPSGIGARKYLMGSGTFTFTGTGNVYDLGTITALDGASNFANATYSFTATSASQRTFIGGGQSYGTFSPATNTSRGTTLITGSNTFATLSLAAGTTLVLTSGTTTTITNAFTLSGTSTNPISIISNNTAAAATLSVGATSTIDWGAAFRITKAGAGSISITNGLDLGGNTSVTITPPSTGGSRCIGC